MMENAGKDECIWNRKILKQKEKAMSGYIYIYYCTALCWAV